MNLLNAQRKILRLALKAFYMQFYKHVRFMEGLQIYPTTKLCYKRQDHVLGIEIGREDFGVKLVFKISNMASVFPLHLCACMDFYNYLVKHLYAKC